MSDPTTVTREQLRAAYDALGLDPDRWKDTMSLQIEVDDVFMIRRWREGDPPAAPPAPNTIQQVAVRIPVTS